MMAKKTEDTILDPPVADRQLVGHATLKVQLSALCRSSRLPHALLFAGPSGAGKYAFAENFARAILYQKETRQAKLIDDWICDRSPHPDLHYVTPLEGKKEITVEAIRETCSKVRLKPYFGVAAVVIIDHAESMNTAASNALLMTLEDPPSHAYFVLVTDAPHRLLETIVSRCQIVNFGELSAAEVSRVLQEVIPECAGRDPLIKNLTALCSGSVAALGARAPFAERDVEAIGERAALFGRAAEAVQKIIKQKKVPDAVAIATVLSAEKESVQTVWQAAIQEVRAEMRREGKNAHLADLLLEAIESERLVRERNMSSNLRLSNLAAELATGK
jgi:hypothetical protein